MTNVPEDYESLLKEYLSLQKQNEMSNQELYDYKRKLKIAEALQLECQSEIELLQSDENSCKKKLETRITQLEDELVNLRLKSGEDVRELEANILKKDEECAQLEAEIDQLRKTNSTISADDNVKLLEEYSVLKEENLALIENLDELKNVLEGTQNQNLILEENVKNYKEEIDGLKESLNCKKEELMETKVLVEKLNDDLLCVRTELDTIKTKPLDQESQGNSLFAEVNDRRVDLQKALNTMKEDYRYMKEDRQKLLKQISMLKNQNKVLCVRWKEEAQNKSDDEDMVNAALTDRVKTLESLLNNCRKELSQKINKSSDIPMFEKMQYFQETIKEKSKEMLILNEKVSSISLNKTILTQDLAKSNEEIRKWKLKATEMECELELFKSSDQFMSIEKDSVNKIHLEVKKVLDQNELTICKCKELKLKELKKELESFKPTKIESCEEPTIKVEKIEAKHVPEEVIVLDDDNEVKKESFKPIKVEKTEAEHVPEEVIVLDDDNEHLEEQITKIEDAPILQIKEELIVLESKENSLQEQDIEVTENVVIEDKSIENKENQNCENIVNETTKCENIVKENASCEESVSKSKIPTKKVTFSESTIEPKSTNRLTLKKPGKRIDAPPVMYF